MHFISAPNSTQFEVFEVKQISGDINLISFCSSFCFMALRVQVPLAVSVCVLLAIRMWQAGVWWGRGRGCTLLYKWHVMLKDGISF